MDARQLSVFIENRKGRLEETLKVLKDGGINILSLSLADTSEYGLLRLIVGDPEKAKKELNDKGFKAMLTDVLVVKIAHTVGALQELLCALSNSEISVEYMYGLSASGNDSSVVIKTNKLDDAKAIVKEKGLSLMTAEELINL